MRDYTPELRAAGFYGIEVGSDEYWRLLSSLYGKKRPDLDMDDGPRAVLYSRRDIQRMRKEDLRKMTMELRLDLSDKATRHELIVAVLDELGIAEDPIPPPVPPPEV